MKRFPEFLRTWRFQTNSSVAHVQHARFPLRIFANERIRVRAGHGETFPAPPVGRFFRLTAGGRLGVWQSRKSVRLTRTLDFYPQRPFAAPNGSRS